MNKNLPICSIFFAMSMLLFFSSSSWFSIWISLELNTMMFLSLLFNKTKKNMESTVNYFIIQSISSLLILFSLLSNQIFMLTSSTPSLLLLISIMLKLGGAPFHNWFIPMCFNINSKNLFWLTISVQKILPLLMLLMVANKTNTLLCMFAILCNILGSSMNMKQNTMKMILILSSLSNMGWMLMALTKNSNIQMYLLFYTLMSALIVMFLHLDMKKMLMNKNINIMMLNLMMLGGMPPLLGFLPKLMVSISLLEKTLLIMLVSMLILSSVDLFIYSRMSFLSLSQSSVSIYWEKKSKENMSKFILINMMGLTWLWL